MLRADVAVRAPGGKRIRSGRFKHRGFHAGAACGGDGGVKGASGEGRHPKSGGTGQLSAPTDEDREHCSWSPVRAGAVEGPPRERWSQGGRGHSGCGRSREERA